MCVNALVEICQNNEYFIFITGAQKEIVKGKDIVISANCKDSS